MVTFHCERIETVFTVTFVGFRFLFILIFVFSLVFPHFRSFFHFFRFYFIFHFLNKFSIILFSHFFLIFLDINRFSHPFSQVFSIFCKFLLFTIFSSFQFQFQPFFNSLSILIELPTL